MVGPSWRTLEYLGSFLGGVPRRIEAGQLSRLAVVPTATRSRSRVAKTGLLRESPK